MEALIRGQHREFVLGDLEEMYARRRTRGGPAPAAFAYVGWGLRSGLLHGIGGALGDLGRDARLALRQIRTHPRLHVGAASVLALGLGMLTIAWGIDYGAYGRGLPVSVPGRMVALTWVNTSEGIVRSGFSPADLEILRSDAPSFDGIGLWGLTRITVSDAAHPPERTYALLTSPSLFGLLELEPLRGRVLRASDAAPGAPRVAVLGNRLWTRRYGADPGVVGRTLDIDGRPTTIVGVLRPGPPFQGEELWLPIESGERHDDATYAVLARTARGTTPKKANAAVSGLGARLDLRRERAEARATLRVDSFADSFREPGSVSSRYLQVVSRAGWLLFLMALANVVNLFLVRTRQRSREIAVRRAMGASRLRVFRHLALEVWGAVLLGALGAAVLASTTLGWYQTAQEAYAEGLRVSWERWGFGGPHLVVLGSAALAAGVAISAVVGAISVRGSGSPFLRAGRGVTSRLRFSQALVALEIAGGGALFLLAALMIRSAWNLRTIDWGFARRSVMTAQVVLGDTDPGSPPERLRLWEELESRLARLPGVESATLATQLPMIRYAGAWNARRAVEIEDRSYDDPSRLPTHYVDAVTPTFFETFQTPVVAGRGLTARDDSASLPVAVANVSFVRTYFPTGDALGRRVRIWNGVRPGPWRTIVGVAPNLWMDSDEDHDPQGLYVPLAQAPPPQASLALRVRGDPETYAGPIRHVVHALAPGVPVEDVRTMPQLIRDRTKLYKRQGPLFIWMGVAALLLAVVGLYAVVSYLASVRMGEFGIRAALGASRPRLVGCAVLWGVPAVATGIGAGVAVGLWLTSGFARFMFEVDPWSPGVAVAGFGVLALTALAASLVPAVRAGRVDVVRILEAE